MQTDRLYRYCYPSSLLPWMNGDGWVPHWIVEDNPESRCATPGFPSQPLPRSDPNLPLPHAHWLLPTVTMGKAWWVRREGFQRVGSDLQTGIHWPISPSCLGQDELLYCTALPPRFASAIMAGALPSFSISLSSYQVAYQVAEKDKAT